MIRARNLCALPDTCLAIGWDGGPFGGAIAFGFECTEDYGGIARTPFVNGSTPRCAPSATATHDNGRNVRDLGPLSDMFD